MQYSISAIGQDSHRFVQPNTSKDLILGGVVIPNAPGLDGNSDADVILHAITNAISGLTTVNILGAVSDEMCLQRGIKDSKEYLKKAFEYLGSIKLTHLSISIEAKRPHLSKYIDSIRESIASIVGLKPSKIGITATTGEGLTQFGLGEGIQVFVIISAIITE